MHLRDRSWTDMYMDSRKRAIHRFCMEHVRSSNNLASRLHLRNRFWTDMFMDFYNYQSKKVINTSCTSSTHHATYVIYFSFHKETVLLHENDLYLNAINLFWFTSKWLSGTVYVCCKTLNKYYGGPLETTKRMLSIVEEVWWSYQFPIKNL